MTQPIDVAFDGFFVSLRQESDRAAAVLGAAFLDTLLADLLRRHLVPGLAKDAFEHNGPLGSFADRTTMAYALGLINSATKADLDLIRRIRNDFAHSHDHKLSFSVDAIRSRARELAVMSAIERVIQEAGSTLGDSPEVRNAVRLTLDHFGPARLRFELCILMLGAAIVEAARRPPIDATHAANAPQIAASELRTTLEAAFSRGEPGAGPAA
jgi:hypothetical protein